jgi:hypothetical protein
MKLVKSKTTIFLTRWAGHVECFGGTRNALKNVGNSKGKRPPRIIWRKWEDNIRMDLREMRWEGVNWMHLAQDRDQ